MTSHLAAVAAMLAVAVSPVHAEPARGYYRFPAIHDRTIVFTAEGDLWTVGLEGGVARRLTSHAALESYASFSPDGRSIAFSASYDGPTEVYVMSAEGGLPRRMTWDGEVARVAGWTRDGRILYATPAHSRLPDAQLASVDPDSGERALIPLSQAAEGAFEESGKTLFFARPAFQGSHTKRYRGGTAQRIWKLPEGDKEATLLTGDFEGTSRWPMWWQGRVYFASDRDGTMNLWSMNDKGSDLRQHTRHQGWDLQSPSLDRGHIVYQLGADLRCFEISSGRDERLDIRLESDFDQMRERWIKKPMDYLTAAHVSPDGERVVLTARGQVFVAPAKQGRLVEATRHAGVRYRQARFFPDGRSLAVLSDETGEVEWWKVPANGVGEPSALTKDGRVLRFDGAVSPDGKRIAYHDKNQELWLLDIASGKSTRIARSAAGEFSDLAWSPDSRWLAYVAPSDNGMGRIWLYGTDEATAVPLTSGRVASSGPAWGLDGKWLYFLSDRNLDSLVPSPWGNWQPEPFLDRTAKIYAAALQKDLRSPFQPVDELHPQPEDKKDADKDKSKPPVTVRVDLDGLERRVYEVPVPADNMESLSVGEKRLFWIARDTSAERKAKLVAVDIEPREPKPKMLLADVKGYELSADGKKLLVRKGDELFVLDASASEHGDLSEKKVPLEAWAFPLDPREEWRQMFAEAWRLERDYFYDPAMHGVDWAGMRKKYEPLVERVTDRGELNDLLAQMVSELSALHIFVRGGDHREGPDQIQVAALGADLVLDEAAGGWRVRRVYRADPDFPDELSPLARPGVEVSDGEVITRINGVGVLSVPDPASLLRNQAGRQVLLEIKGGKGGPSREVVVVPLSPERAVDLRYDEWEYTRRLEVENAGKGDIGYVHLRAMGGGNYTEWARNFYPVYRRKGLIVDVRHNRGGSIDSWILEKLLRRAWFYWQPRVGIPDWNMQFAFRGHVVVLVDEWTASDGEAFAEGFRRLGLGKVIGTRTWGGEIWLSGSNVLVDKGIATAAETGVFGPEGEWLIEGRGVDPDIVVDNLPRATFDGRDAQLEAAIAYLQEKLRKEPVSDPAAPLYPDKSR
jgi:tricorn protease